MFNALDIFAPSLTDEIISVLKSLSAKEMPHGQRFRHVGPRPARGVTYQPNGARECKRRIRQIKEWRLNLENGWAPLVN